MTTRFSRFIFYQHYQIGVFAPVARTATAPAFKSATEIYRHPSNQVHLQFVPRHNLYRNQRGRMTIFPRTSITKVEAEKEVPSAAPIVAFGTICTYVNILHTFSMLK